MKILSLLAAFALTATPVLADNGWTPIVSDPQIHVVLIGERHGYKEAPELAASALTEAARHRDKLLLVLEIYEEGAQEEGRLKTYLNSDGSAAARKALVSGSDFWEGAKDGRPSESWFALLECARKLRADGHDVLVRSAIPSTYSGTINPETGRPYPWDETGGDRIEAFVKKSDIDLTLGLMGSYHSRKGVNGIEGHFYQQFGRAVGADSAVRTYKVTDNCWESAAEVFDPANPVFAEIEPSKYGRYDAAICVPETRADYFSQKLKDWRAALLKN